ncbi:MAG: CsgG/HfaB family protein, partial [Fibrobacterota bacterium]
MPRFFLVFLICSWAQAATVHVAVNDLTPRGVATSEAEILGDRLRMELLGTGVFRVMERGQMDQILKEQSFQASGGCEQSECAVEIGKLLA